jgi:transposase
MNASFVLGIDPGKFFFVATLVDTTGGEPVWKARPFDMSREGFESLRCSLPQADLTVGVEASGRMDDNLVVWLRQWASTRGEHRVRVIRVNPGQSARFGGPKPRRNQTDGSDSEHIAEFTRVYAHRLEAFDYSSEAQSMARLIRERERLIVDLAATKNRLHDQLLVCFPEFTRLFPDPFAKLARAVLRQAPTARRAARRRALSLARVKTGRRGPSLGVEKARHLIALAKDSIASAGEDNDARALVFLLDQLEMFEIRVAEIDRTLSSYVQKAEDEMPDNNGVSAAQQIALLDSAPGMGIVAASTLVLGTRGLTRFYSGQALSAQWACCPEQIQTGTSLHKTRLTARGDHKQRAMLYLSTQVACVHDPAFAFHKWRMTQKGLCPQQAVCAAMNRMARVTWAMVAKNETYDVNRMLEQIRIHHADSWKTFVRLNQKNRRLWKKVRPDLKKIA